MCVCVVVYVCMYVCVYEREREREREGEREGGNPKTKAEKEFIETRIFNIPGATEKELSRWENSIRQEDLA